MHRQTLLQLVLLLLFEQFLIFYQTILLKVLIHFLGDFQLAIEFFMLFSFEKGHAFDLLSVWSHLVHDFCDFLLEFRDLLLFFNRPHDDCVSYSKRYANLFSIERKSSLNTVDEEAYHYVHPVLDHPFILICDIAVLAEHKPYVRWKLVFVSHDTLPNLFS